MEKEKEVSQVDSFMTKLMSVRQTVNLDTVPLEEGERTWFTQFIEGETK